MSEALDKAPAPRRKRGLLTRAKRLLARSIAVCVIGLALLVGVFRLALPLAPNYHAQIEVWAGRALDVRVILSEVDARWPLLSGPELVFEDAALWSPDGEALLLSAERGSVALDLMELLTSFSVKPGKVVLRGVVIDVEHRTDEGGWQVLGRAVAPDGAQANAGSRPRGAQALPRGRLEIEDATIVVTDDRNGPNAGPSRVSGVHLDFAHERGALNLEGSLQAPGDGGEVSFSAEGRDLGDAARDGRWQFFLSGSNVDLGAIGSIVGLEPTALHGIGSVTLWASRNRGRIEGASLTLDLDDLLLAGDADHAVQYDRLAGRFNLNAEDDGWALIGRDLEVARGGHRWPSSSFSIEIDSHGLQAARADYLRLDDLLPLARLAMSLDPAEREGYPRRLLAMAPSGELSSLRFERDTPDGLALASRFDGLAVQAAEGMPGVVGVSGLVDLRGPRGHLEMDSSALEIAVPDVFRQALPAMAVDGAVDWTTDADGRHHIRAPAFTLAGPAFQADGKMELRWPGAGDEGPYLDLELALTEADLALFRRYVPALRLAPGVGRWLEKAFVSGTVPAASIAFTGPVKAFPFDQDEGEFLARVQVQDIELDYADGFPHATGLTGVVAFDNVHMEAEGFSGTTRGNSLRTLEVEIADLRVGVLEYRGRTRGSLAAVIDYLRNSQFARHVAPLEEVAGRGEVALNFTLPLRKREDAQLAAELDAQEGLVKLAGLPIPLEDVEGTLRYDSADGLSGEGITGSVMGREVGVRLIPLYDQDGKAITSQLEVDGRFDVGELAQGLNMGLDAYVEGAANFLASLRLPLADEEFRSLSLESDLVGARLQLPAPLGKAAEQSLPSSVVISHATSGAAGVTLSLGQIMRARVDGTLIDDALTLDRGAVTFGGGAPELPDTVGVSVSGRLEELDLSGWGGVYARVASATAQPVATEGDAAAPLPGLHSLDLRITRLRAMGQELADVRVDLRHVGDKWALGLEGADLAGEVFLPEPTDSGPLVARFSRLHIPPPVETPVSAMIAEATPAPAVDASAATEPAPLDPRSLPTLVLEIDDFTWQRLAFGRVALELQADEAGIRLPHLLVEGESYRLEGDGEWLVSEAGQHTSALNLAMRSSDLLSTLERLDFAGTMSATSASLDAQFQWQGPPRLALDDSLSGEMRVAIEEGQLLNVRPGAGKIFGLMSVAALPRRLELDFRDVFDKGLGFDEISGTFTIADGNAYTEDLKLLGQTADVRISGRTGLVSRDYDQTADVLANVGSPLPVAGALAGGPVVGAALLIFSELMKEPLKDLSRTQYRITGPWADPTVQRVALPSARRRAEDGDEDAPVSPTPRGR